jgi:hypothetical protein
MKCSFKQKLIRCPKDAGKVAFELSPIITFFIFKHFEDPQLMLIYAIQIFFCFLLPTDVFQGKIDPMAKNTKKNSS